MTDTFLSQYLHQKRLLLIFSKNKDAHTYIWQKNELDQHQSQLNDRNVKVISLFAESPEPEEPMSDTETTAQLWEQFNIEPDRLTVLLLDTDGREKLRDNRPVAAQALLSIIDVLPSRKKEMGR